SIKRLKVAELHFMLSLIQLALNVDRVTLDTLAKKYAPGTLYILPIIGALDMRTQITRKETTEGDLESLAYALRTVQHGMWLPMVHRLMIPAKYMAASDSYVNNLQLHYDVPLPVGAEAHTMSFGFRDVATSDTILDGIVTKRDPRLRTFAPIHHIKTPLKYKKTKCPVTRKNRESWTEKERLKAEKAAVVESLDDLGIKVKNLHKGGKTSGDYIEINSKILDGKALKLDDANGKLLAFLFIVPEEYRQGLADAILHIHACMPGEFKDDDSRRDFFKYLSCHYSWYARYAENGKKAPKGVHPNKVRKSHRGKVTFTQRNSAKWALLAEAYHRFLRANRILPEDYQELSIYVEHLPLDASSPAYPFGGFVLNISACTWAHRDKGDKRLCLVVPFGSFKGGQLCLFETGFSFDLQLGDVLIFPSADLTHFNLHFQGQRGTLVLHSDRQGDGWVRDRHGWDHVLVHTAGPDT
ncbi:hypothetical protein C8R43DRAFT_1054194, partial [Mycena crocata]